MAKPKDLTTPSDKLASAHQHLKDGAHVSDKCKSAYAQSALEYLLRLPKADQSQRDIATAVRLLNAVCDCARSQEWEKVRSRWNAAVLHFEHHLGA
jgi:hypothetical protein